MTSEVGTEDFESYNWDDSDLDIDFPGAGTASLFGDGQVYSTEAVPGADLDKIQQELNTGRYAVSGIKYFQARANVGVSSGFSIEMSEEVAAFGFYAYDLGDFGGNLEIRLYNDGELVGTISNSDHNLYEVRSSGYTSGSALYVGIIGELKTDGTHETFDRVEFVIENQDGSNYDEFGLDDMTIATADQIINQSVVLYAD